MTEFKKWPSIRRLNRNVVITEKIDGTNGAIHIDEVKRDPETGVIPTMFGDIYDAALGRFFRVSAQSRTRLITPDQDNFGFAQWVQDNAKDLYGVLGTGLHFGEWWGYKIQRGYDLPKGDRRFSLFNVSKWADAPLHFVPGLSTVPVITEGTFFGRPWEEAMSFLAAEGSLAAPGFRRPEGMVVYHEAGDVMFKWTVGDDGHKGEQKGRHHKADPEPMQSAFNAYLEGMQEAADRGA